RPADVIGNAVKVRIATGEETEERDLAKSAAAELGTRGGKARAAQMTPERRREIRRKRLRRAGTNDDQPSASSITCVIRAASCCGSFFAHSAHIACQSVSPLQ